MNYFYFDASIHRFLTKQHKNEEKNQINQLIFDLGIASGSDLYKGFKSVWGPGQYLECVDLGKKLFTETAEEINYITLPEQHPTNS